MLQVVTMRHGVLAALVALAAAGGCADRGDMAGAMTDSSQAMAGEPKMAMAQNSTVMVGGQPMLPTKTIVGNAVNSADHTTLVAAVTAAGLVDTLQGEGPFTVFAPVNSAFAALPPGTVDQLMKPESRENLTVKANGPTNLVIEDQKGDVATISTYDVYQSNGVIHVIDEVLLPS